MNYTEEEEDDLNIVSSIIDYKEENGGDLEVGTFKIQLADIVMHPIALTIYNYKGSLKEIKALAATLKVVGQLEPITVNTKNEIISGNRRYKAALYLGWTELNAVRVIKGNEEQETKTIVFHNQQRKKKTIEIIREAEGILGTLKKKQGERRDLMKEEKGNPFGKIGKDRYEIAAKVIGDISASTLRRTMDVVEFEKESEENKSLGLVEKIVSNQLSANRAHTMMKSYLEEKAERAKRKAVKIKPINTDDFKVYNKSSDKMTEVKANSVQVVFTSPPYYNLRNYGNAVKGKPELGHETSAQDFVSNLSKHFKDVKRVLKDTGSFFLNIGETYNKGENLLIPTRLVLHLCDKEGWFLVNEIIWRKTNPLPQATDKRLQPTYEKIFHLVKDPNKYFYQEFKLWNDKQARVVRSPADRSAGSTERGESGFMLAKSYQKFKDFIDEQTVKDVITGPNGSVRQTELKKIDPSTDHPALMPDYLPIIPILTTSKEGDIILDPFSGSGTTGKTSLMLGRKYVGYELNKKNYEMSLLDLNATIKPSPKK